MDREEELLELPLEGSMMMEREELELRELPELSELPEERLEPEEGGGSTMTECEEELEEREEPDETKQASAAHES